MYLYFSLRHFFLLALISNLTLQAILRGEYVEDIVWLAEQKSLLHRIT